VSGVIEIRLTGTIEQIAPLYDKFLKRAIQDMLSQDNMEGCRECWANWKSFQKDKLFIQAKDGMKKKLTTK